MVLLDTVARTDGARMPSVDGNPEVWQATEVKRLAGVLYQRPECEPSITRKVLQLAQSRPGFWKKPLSHGEFGEVYDYGGVAYKRYFAGNAPRDDWHSGLIGLRANVALNVGLQALQPVVAPPALGGDPVTYTFRAPRMHAAFIPDIFTENGAKPVWAMELLHGVSATEQDVPTEEVRWAHYNAAAEASGITGGTFHYDNDLGNLYVTNRAPGRIDLAKFDVMALSSIEI